MKFGVAVMKNSYWTIFKTVDIKSLGIQINNNIELYNKLNELITVNHLDKELVVIRVQIDTLIKTVEHKFHQLLPYSMRKRAIFSPLGSLVKVITGNLDEEDAIKFNEEISKISNREYLTEIKVSSLHKAFATLANISEIMNHNIENLHFKTNEFDKVVEKEIKISNVIRTMNSLYQILNNFRYIYESIQEIETAIAFSKLHTLHQSIINSTELLGVFKVIENHAQTIYPVTKNNLLKLERNIILKSYIDKNKLVFVLEIPLIESETYNYYKVIPIPITKSSKTYTIIPKYPYLLVNGLKYRNVLSPCESIEDNKYLCSEENMATINEETCIEELMLIKNNYSLCYQHHIRMEKLKIQKIMNNSWLIFTTDKIILTEHCRNDVRRFSLLGTYIVTPSQRCSMQIGRTIFGQSSNASDMNMQLPLAVIPEIQQDLATADKKLDVTNVDFSDVKEMLNNIRNSNSEIVVESVVTHNISIWTIVLYLIVVVVAISIVLKFKLYSIFNKRNSPKPPSAPSDNFSLREGGVKNTNPIHICFASTKPNVGCASAASNT